MSEHDELIAATGPAESLCPARRFPLRKPEGHQPPITRYSAVLPQREKIVVLFLGLQARDIEAIDHAALRETLSRVDGPAAPQYIDAARFVDPQGYVNQVTALYWLGVQAFHDWQTNAALTEWRSRIAANSTVGLWWEPVVVDADHAETIAFREFRRGFAGCPATRLATTDRTGYWGAARDRIPAAADKLFEPTTISRKPQLDAAQPQFRKVQPPTNMAVIRSGVSWQNCEGEQLVDYQEHIRPKLDAGMEYLRSHPQETGCFALRQVTCVGSDGEALREGYSLGAFVSLGHLESWAEHHPSHLAIYARAMASRRKYQDRLQLRTYNEIFIVGADNPPFEYVNCHAATGLLPYADNLLPSTT